MSANCMCCNNDICPPNDFWSGFTYFSPSVNYLCGACLNHIPDEHKVRFNEMPLFQVLFAQRNAEVGSSGAYQGFGSKSDAPRFYVEANVVARYLPNGFLFLKELYPYYCIADFPYKVVELFAEKTEEASDEAFGLLCKYGAPLEAMLFKKNPEELVRPRIFKGNLSSLTESEKKLAAELLSEIFKQYMQCFF